MLLSDLTKDLPLPAWQPLEIIEKKRHVLGSFPPVWWSSAHPHRLKRNEPPEVYDFSQFNSALTVTGQ